MRSSSGSISTAVEGEEGVTTIRISLVGELPEVVRHGMPEDGSHSRQMKPLF